MSATHSFNWKLKVLLTATGVLLHFGACAQVWSIKTLLEKTNSPTINLLKDKQQVDKVERLWLLRVDDISERIASAYGMEKPRLFISKQDGPNAFVTADKQGPLMVVGTDMLKLVGDDDDLMAAVIGHEFGHLKGDHLRKAKNSAAVVGLIGLLAGLALDVDQAKKGVDTQGLGMDLGNLGSGLVNAKFSRDDEREADQFGIERMAQAGFNPDAASRLWRTMEKYGGGSGLWLSTHPSSSERYSTLSASANTLMGAYTFAQGNVSKARPTTSRVAILLQDAKAADKIENYAKAIEIYKSLAEWGNGPAQYSIGYYFDSGKGVEKDPTQALLWYGKAADQGVPSALVQLGYAYGSGKGVAQDNAKAAELFRQASDKGHLPASALLGQMYERGLGVAKDEKEALSLYKKAAEAGDSLGQMSIGNLYLAGRIVQKDEAQALLWYRKAADRGYPGAQARIGQMYANGQGVAKDDIEALKWYRMAAERESPAALMELGEIYRFGRGVAKDDNEARAWYQKAANKGNAKAAQAISQMAATAIESKSPDAQGSQSERFATQRNPDMSTNKKAEQRLLELKSLFDKGLIEKPLFEKKRLEILNSI